MKEITPKNLTDNIAREDNEMLIRRFVAAVGYDYIEHDKKHSAQIHPDFSEDTIALWQEIEDRLHGTVTLVFDREQCESEIHKRMREQGEIMKEGATYTSSYHYGIHSGLSIALRIVEDCVTKEVKTNE